MSWFLKGWWRREPLPQKTKQKRHKGLTAAGGRAPSPHRAPRSWSRPALLRGPSGGWSSLCPGSPRTPESWVQGAAQSPVSQPAPTAGLQCVAGDQRAQRSPGHIWTGARNSGWIWNPLAQAQVMGGCQRQPFSSPQWREETGSLQPDFKDCPFSEQRWGRGAYLCPYVSLHTNCPEQVGKQRGNHQSCNGSNLDPQGMDPHRA